ncbi:MAG: 1,4-dihydroxy-2-naphthoate polyprenyltransferase [Polyangiales bacterium]|nr:1,4-dihydroxy-2-naphthoate polyprenyltransferase [Myxococcales bacterium]
MTPPNTANDADAAPIVPSHSAEVRPGSARAWLLAARPQTLTAAFVPVAVGAAVALAEHGARWAPALAALLGAFAIQIGTNFANDVFDFEKGADTDARVGPTRAVHAGLLSPRAMRRGMIASFGVATLAGAYLVVVGGYPVVLIGLASIASGIAYTGGPFPLGYNGLGDVFVMVFFGFVAVCGTAYVSLGYVPTLAWWASAPVGALATTILVVNNVRDRETDRTVGKRTLAVRFGLGGAIAEYAFLLTIAYAVPLVLWWSGASPVAVLAPLVTLPWAAWLLVRVATRSGTALNPVLASTAKLLLVYGVAFAVGLGWDSAPW